MKRIWRTMQVLTTLAVLAAFSACATLDPNTPPIKGADGNIV